MDNFEKIMAMSSFDGVTIEPAGIGLNVWAPCGDGTGTNKPFFAVDVDVAIDEAFRFVRGWYIESFNFGSRDDLSDLSLFRVLTEDCWCSPEEAEQILVDLRG